VKDHVKAYSDYIDRCAFIALHGDLEYPPRSRPGSICDKKRNPCGCSNKSGEERVIYSAVFDSLFDLKTDKHPVKICDTLLIRGGNPSNIMKMEDRPRSINKNMVRMLTLSNCCPCALDTTDISCRIPITFCRFDDIPTVKFIDPETNQEVSPETYFRKYIKPGLAPPNILTKAHKDTLHIVLSKIALMKNRREGLVCVRKYYNRPNYFAEHIFLLEKSSEKWYIKAKWTLFDYSQQMVKL
jgi:hypothetical protein